MTVVGHWELSWNTPIKEAELWNLPLRDFGVTDWWMWPISGIRNNEERDVRLHERPSIDDILQEVEGTRVFVEANHPHFPLESEWLQDFTHPDDAVYIFGSAHFNPTVAHKREDDLAVTVPTALNGGLLWPHQCLVAILYDRLVKA